MRIDNIADYIMGIKHLISLGYYVIRMGKHNNLKCNINNKQFIKRRFIRLRTRFLACKIGALCAHRLYIDI